MDGRKLYPQSWYLKKILLIGLSNGTKVIYFLSCINLSTFLPLNPAICTIYNVSNILCSRCKGQDDSPPPPPDFTLYCKLSKFILDYISGLWATKKLVSKPSHWDFHRNCRMTYILPNFLEVFLRHVYYCHRKVFYKGDNKINKFSNSKCNLVSRFNKLQGATIELSSKDNFLRTWNSLMNNASE